MTSIHVRGLTKTYRGKPPARALDGVELDVADGSLVAVLGPSGCGKTTLLRIIAGFERPDAGTVAFGDVTVGSATRSTPPERRRIGIVPQEGALFPHLDVDANVRFALAERRGAAARARVDELLDLVGLHGFGARRPHELSGGQQQRVSLARALAGSPRLVLLDEPFTALDVSLRERVRTDVAEVLRRSGATALMVTHDPAEALVMADVVAVMRAGRIEQVGTSRDIYQRPATADVAAALGEVVSLAGRAAAGLAATDFGSITVPTAVHDAVTVLVRPEQIRRDDTAAVRVRVEEVRYHGHDGVVVLRAGDAPGGPRVTARWPAAELPAVGSMVGIRLDGAAMLAVSRPT